MKPKKHEMIKLLIDKHSNAKRLAELLDLSVRTIKNYVREINDEYPQLITSSIKGYEIDQIKAIEILDNQNDLLPQTSKERVFFIIARLLSDAEHSNLDIYDLSEELFVSVSTLRKDLISVRRKIAKFDLSLMHQEDIVSIEGTEKNKRKLLSSILYEESSINFISYSTLESAFNYIDIYLLKNTITAVFEKHHFFINDFSLINLVLHMSIAIDRIKNNLITTTETKQINQIQLKEYDIAREITDVISERMNINYSKNEIQELALLIASRATSLNYQNITKSNIETYVGKECMELVYHLQESINHHYHLNLFDADFTVRFALHIRNLLIRSKNNNFSKNPLADNLKKTCPMLYEVSVRVAAEFKRLTGIFVNDDEIAYFAFHIGSAIESSENLKEKVKVVYYSPNYYNAQDQMIKFLKRHFDKEILVTNIITDEGELVDISSPDIIVTSIPISKPLATPVVQTTILLNDVDKKILSNAIFQVQKKKKLSEFRYYLRKLIKPDLFEINSSITDSKECMTYMATKLIELNYANKEFVSEVLERESMSSTCFSYAAIPHSMYMNSNKTSISVLINPDGISWGNTTAFIVLMMSFNKNERKIFNDIFEPISMILAEKENLSRLIKSKTYKDFISEMGDLFLDLNSF